jgi:hypothetical protein
VTTDDAKPIIRTLRDALQDARPYVFQRIIPPGHPERDWRAETAESTLERVDGAIAEADEVLS